jgi:CO/xanthine dehydrogenase Mo-binding subunit
MSLSESLETYRCVDDWIVVAPNRRTTVRTGKVDIGQRISTALALIASEELDVDFSRIDVETVDTATSLDEEYTSAGLPYLGPSECAVGPTAAAIANAIHDATGLRLQRLPFNADTIRQAALQ